LFSLSISIPAEFNIWVFFFSSSLVLSRTEVSKTLFIDSSSVVANFAFRSVILINSAFNSSGVATLFS